MNVDETNMILNKNARNIRRLKIRFEVNLSNAIDQIKKNAIDQQYIVIAILEWNLF